MTAKNSSAFEHLLDQADELRSDQTLQSQAEPTPSFLYRVSATVERETGKRPDPENLAKLVWLAFDATPEELDDVELPGGEARADFSGEFSDAARELTSGFEYKNPSTKRGKAGRAGSGSRPFLLHHQHQHQSRVTQQPARAAVAPANLFNHLKPTQQSQIRRGNGLTASNPGQYCLLLAFPMATSNRAATVHQRNQVQAQVQNPAQRSEVQR